MFFFLHLHFQEQIVIKTFIQKGKAELQAKCGRRQSMRYNGGFIMQYLLLKLKSSTTYTHLRKNNFLSLPRSLTIRQRLCSSNCKLCSNDLSLENIMKAMVNLIAADRWSSLIWDEIFSHPGFLLN